MTTSAWPATADELIDRQLELAALADEVEPWRPPRRPLRVAAVFCAFPTGRPGPGAAGDPTWTAAVLWETADPVPLGRSSNPPKDHPRGRLVAGAVTPGAAGAPYVAGLLGLRVGAVMEEGLRALPTDARPDVVVVDATGRDHPRRAGLALHVGAALDLPSVGVTNRALEAVYEQPGARAGAVGELRLQGLLVGYALRAHPQTHPVLVHAGWRVDPDTALAVVGPLVGHRRTPEPLRLARRAARVARARAEGRHTG